MAASMLWSRLWVAVGNVRSECKASGLPLAVRAFGERRTQGLECH